MTVETLRHFFAWCAVINYAMLLLWFFLYAAAYGWMAGLSQRLFGISTERYDSLSFSGMLYFKLGIFLFNIGPYIALRIMA